MPNHALKAACASVVAAATICSLARAQAPEHGTDRALRPGDDFFAWANAEWLGATAIPDGLGRWGVRNEIDALTRRQVLALLDDAAAAPAGSRARRVADYRAAYLDEAAIEARGLAPLRPMLDSIDQVTDKAALTRFLGSQIGDDVDPLNFGVFQSSRPVGLSVEQSIHGEPRYVAFLVQGGLGLPDHDTYLGTGPAALSLRARYEQHVGRMLALAGFDRTGQRAAAVVALETGLAASQVTQQASANDHRADTLWTHGDFARHAPGMYWHSFFEAAGVVAADSIVPWQPGAMAGVAALVGSESLETWKDYLRVHLLDEMADVLPLAFADEALAMRTAVTGQPPRPRGQRAVDATLAAMSDDVGRLYVERYFGAAQKQRIQGIVANVEAAFVPRVQAATWMSPATRTQALAKLRTLYVGIAYPERWQDDADVGVDPHDAAGNMRRVQAHRHLVALGRLGKPVDPAQWWMPPQSVGALLVFQQNAYTFAAALLQPPKFDSTASDAELYGSIGAILGHDVTHYVDVLGADYDTTGAERRWWTALDLARFNAAAEPLASQFSAYHPFADLGVNGRLTLTENVADLAGLTAALEAFHRTLGPRRTDQAFVRAQDRAFFIAWARSWRMKLRDDAYRTQVASSDHAPENFRVNTVRNLDAWYDAFDVRPGQGLYLDPSARVRVW